MDIVKGVPQERCSHHGEGCKCTPGIVTQCFELWAECSSPDHEVSEVRQVCCDNGHEFVFPWQGASGEGQVNRGGVSSKTGDSQFGHVWSDGPRCREHCPNHGPH
jgi:hypothetical protein